MTEAAADCAAVHVMRLYLAPLLDGLIDSPRRPRLSLDLDELEPDSDPDRGAFTRLAEYYLRRVDHAFLAAPEDAAAISRRHPQVRVDHVPNAVALPASQSVGPPGADAADLLFVGNLSYAPNVEGAVWLVEYVLPRLGAVRVNLVGSRPPREILQLSARTGIAVHPDVPDVAPWYTHARVAVVPLLRGGGTRIKVIEALAHSRPVVSAPVGARGLGLSDGRDPPVLLGQEPAEFAGACRRLLEDPHLARRLGENGREQVARAFGREGTVDRIAAVLATARGPGSGRRAKWWRPEGRLGRSADRQVDYLRPRLSCLPGADTHAVAPDPSPRRRAAQRAGTRARRARGSVGERQHHPAAPRSRTDRADRRAGRDRR